MDLAGGWMTAPQLRACNSVDPVYRNTDSPDYPFLRNKDVDGCRT